MFVLAARIVPPYFSIPPERLYELMPGGDLNLTCVAVGSPMPYVSWRKGSIELNTENIPIGKNVLRLTDMQESVNYTCVASSKYGTVNRTTSVIVRSLPRPPTNVRVSDVTPTSLRLSWSYDIGVENVAYFIIQYKPKSASQYKEISGITTTFYKINELTPYTEYEFIVVAVNTIGRGQSSTPLMITTGETSKLS